MDGIKDFLGILGILGNLERKNYFPYYFTCFKSYSVIRFTSSSKLV